jgi:hypothetical protein
VRAEEIREHRRAVSFRPLRVFLSDGSVHEILDPRLAMITLQYLTIGTNLRRDDIPRDSVMCDPMHVIRIEAATHSDDTQPEG